MCMSWATFTNRFTQSQWPVCTVGTVYSASRCVTDSILRTEFCPIAANDIIETPIPGGSYESDSCDHYTMTAVILIAIAVSMPGSRTRRVSAQSPTLSGAYGFSLTIPYSGYYNGTGVLQGAVTFDGMGNATTSGGILVSVDSNTNANVPQVQQLPSNPGTYKVNSDGTGTLTFQNANGNATSFSFVITDGGSQLTVVATGGFGNALVTGIARKQ